MKEVIYMNCKLTLGEKLKDLRTAVGLSLIELEEATGISKSALSSTAILLISLSLKKEIIKKIGNKRY